MLVIGKREEELVVARKRKKIGIGEGRRDIYLLVRGRTPRRGERIPGVVSAHGAMVSWARTGP